MIALSNLVAEQGSSDPQQSLKPPPWRKITIKETRPSGEIIATWKTLKV
jgi:hypothetical protein